MTEERAHDVVEHTISHSQGKKVSLQWFGGEPLVEMKIISLICRELTDNFGNIYSGDWNMNYLRVCCAAATECDSAEENEDVHTARDLQMVHADRFMCYDE